MDDAGIARRNGRALLAQGILFFVGVAFLDANTVLPLFVERFSGRADLAGAAATIRQSAALLLQFGIGLAVPRIRSLPRYLATVMVAGYGLPLLMAPVLLASQDSRLIVGSLLAVVALFWTADGAVVVAWYDLFGRTVPARSRGRILGFQQLFGGIGAVAAAFAIKLVLDADALPARTQYLLVFSAGGLILLASGLCMVSTVDAPRPTRARERLAVTLRRIPRVLAGNGRFRTLATIQLLFTLSVMCVPHLIVFSKNSFALPPRLVTWLIGIQVAGTLGGGLAAALAAHRWGNDRLIAFFTASGLGTALCGLAALAAMPGSPAAWPILAVLVFFSGVSGASWTGFANRAIDVLPPEDLPVGMAAVSLLSFPLSLAPYLAGIAAGRFGYGALLGTCAVFAAASLAVAVAVRADEPRGGTDRP